MSTTPFDLGKARQEFKRAGRDMSPENEEYYRDGWSRFGVEWKTPKEVGCDYHLAESLFWSGLLERRESHANGQKTWFRHAEA